MTPSLSLTSAGILSVHYHTGVLKGTFNDRCMSCTLVMYVMFQYKLPGTCTGFYLTPAPGVQDEKWVRLHAFSFSSVLFLPGTAAFSSSLLRPLRDSQLFAVLRKHASSTIRHVLYSWLKCTPQLSGTLAEKKNTWDLCMLAISCQELTAAAGGHQSLCILFL